MLIKKNCITKEVHFCHFLHESSSISLLVCIFYNPRDQKRVHFKTYVKGRCTTYNGSDLVSSNTDPMKIFHETFLSTSTNISFEVDFAEPNWAFSICTPFQRNFVRAQSRSVSLSPLPLEAGFYSTLLHARSRKG